METTKQDEEPVWFTLDQGKRQLKSAAKYKEFKELSSHLEHVVTVGAAVQRGQKRLREFEDTLEAELRDNPTEVHAPDPSLASVLGLLEKSKGAKRKQGELVRCHAEDARLYWKQNVSPVPSNKNNRGKKKSHPPRSLRPDNATQRDDSWNKEHGDSINPLAFSRARLSQAHGKAPPTGQVELDPVRNVFVPTREDLVEVDGDNRHASTTDTSLEAKYVPKAMLLRCWERAVHAASSQISVPVGGGDASTSPVGPQPDTSEVDSSDDDESWLQSMLPGASNGTDRLSSQQQQQQQQQVHREGATSSPFTTSLQQLDGDPQALAQKCESLGVKEVQRAIHSFNRIECGICGGVVQGGNEEEVLEHYCGLKKENHPGGSRRPCCWARLEQAHRFLISKALEKLMTTQTSQLLSLIDISFRNDERFSQSDRSRAQSMMWYDVLKALEITLSDAKEKSDEKPSHPVLETLQVTTEQSPMFLNPMILRSTRMRLIQRYADLPP